MNRCKNVCVISLTFISVLLCFGLTIRTLPLVFMTYDDASIQMALSGVHTGEPYPYHQFINLFLGYMITALYNITTVVPWWYVWSILCVLIGIFCIHWTIIKNARMKREALFFICIFMLSFWVCVLGNIAFTVVPCVLSMGIVFLLFSNEQPRWSYPFVITGVVVILLSYWHREDTGYVMLCYFGMGLLYYVLHCVDMNNKQRKVRFIGTFGITVVFLLLTKQIDYLVKEDINPATFTEFNEARIDYMDYLHITYDEVSEVFHQYGWDKNLAALVDDWCFLDERVTTEAFQGIYQADSQYRRTSFVTPLISLLSSNDYALCLTGLCICVAILGEIYICINGFWLSQINFFFISNIGGSFVLLLYLIIRGRLPLRAYMIVVIPMILISCLLMLKVRAHSEKKFKNEFIWNTSLAILLILAITSFIQNYDVESMQDKQAKVESCNMIDDFIKENAENIYITDIYTYNNINPFSQTSHNLFWWGDSTFYSDYYYRQLQMNGLSELNMESFKLDNVYFITRSIDDGYNDEFYRLYECLRDYNVVEFEEVDNINGVIGVYKFRFDDNQ